MVSKEDRSFLVGVSVAVILSTTLHLLLKYELMLSITIGIIAGVAVGLVMNEVKK